MELKGLLDMKMQVDRQCQQYPSETRSFMEHLMMYGLMVNKAPDEWAHRNYYQVVTDLAPGPRYAPLTLPEGYDQMEAQQCFHNAWELVCEDPSLYYVEGFAQAGTIPTEHAWVETHDGTIIDPTWSGRVDETTHAAYLGVRFTASLAMRLSVETGWASIFFGDNTSKGRNRILQHGLDMQDGIATNIKEHQ